MCRLCELTSMEQIPVPSSSLLYLLSKFLKSLFIVISMNIVIINSH